MTKWEKAIDIKQFITDDDSDEGARTACKGIANLLKKELPSNFEIEEIIELLSDAQNLEEGNSALELLYDYADENSIWLGLIGNRREDHE